MKSGDKNNHPSSFTYYPHFGNLGVNAIIILNWTLRKTGCEGERWTEVPVYRVQQWTSEVIMRGLLVP